MTAPTNQPGFYTVQANTAGLAGQGQLLVMSNSSWDTKYQHSLKVDGDLLVSGDVKVDGVSLKEFVEQVSRRLAILTPDPKRLERYEALRQAYEHYLTLEALLVSEEK